MISGIGIDIADVALVVSSIRDYGREYLQRVFTPAEIEYCGAVPIWAQRYAGRVAAKEAAMKALSTGWGQGVEWLNFEIVNESSGQPILWVRGTAAQIMKERGISKTWVSISHVPEYAIAQVVLEE